MSWNRENVARQQIEEYMAMLDDIPLFYIGDMADDAPVADDGDHEEVVGPASPAALPVDVSWGV